MYKKNDFDTLYHVTTSLDAYHEGGSIYYMKARILTEGLGSIEKDEATGTVLMKESWTMVCSFICVSICQYCM